MATHPIIGITAEWNPFHKGHASMIQQIQDRYPKALLVGAMSGSFVQRGEPALFDKWTRAKWAMEAGVSIVFELPILYALQSADLFSSYAVDVLASAGVTHMAFGTESLGEDPLYEAARFAISPSYEDALHDALERGVSYGEAAHQAMAAYSPFLATELLKPNNLLGFRYTETILRKQYPIEILVIHRDMEHPISATKARKDLAEKKDTSLLPSYAQEEGARKMEEGDYTDFSRYEESCLLWSRQYTGEALRRTGLFREGLENKWYKESAQSSYTQMLDAIKSKRYLYSRLKRIGAELLLSRGNEMSPFSHLLPPGYLRLLGLRREESAYLRHCHLPVITSVAKGLRTLSEEYRNSLLLDIHGTDMRAFMQKNPSYRKGREDYYHSPLIM